MKLALNQPFNFLTPKEKNETVHFVHTQPLALEKPAHIVLSPYFYWVKKADFELSSVKQALKIAPSVFESEIPEGEYTYDAYKLNGEIIFICYDREYILQHLETQGIFLDKIKSLSLAQYHFDQLQTPLLYDDLAVVVQDAIVTLVSQQYVQTNTPNLLQEVDGFLTSHFKKGKHIPIGSLLGVDFAPFKVLASVAAVLLLVVVSSEYYRLTTQATQLEQNIESIKAKYHLPRTMIQLKSIEKTLSKRRLEQNFFRESLYAITKERFAINGTLNRIKINNKLLTVQFAKKDATIQNKLKKRLKKAHFKPLESGFEMQVQP